MSYRYDTAHLTGQQKAIINQRDERDKLLKKSNEETTENIVVNKETIFHEKDFQELKERIEKEQKIKLILRENHKNHFFLIEKNPTSNSDTAEGTVNIVFRFDEKKLIISNFFLRITGIGTGSHIIEWFIRFCKENMIGDFMIRIVRKDNVVMNKICEKYGFERIDNDENCNDYLLKII